MAHPLSCPPRAASTRAFNHAPMVFALVTAIAACLDLPLHAAESIRILPGDVTLDGPGARHRLIAERYSDNTAVGAHADGVRWKVADPDVVRIDSGTLFPLRDGKTAVSVETPSGSASIQVTVRNSDARPNWSFRNHVEPVLTRAGCNMGACHGAAAGKNGFTLTLRGYDSATDHRAITRHSFGRRVDPEDPGRSLLLTKPTGAVPHKGGKRFEVDSPEYRVLAEWIAAGTPEPRDDDPKLGALEILPKGATLAPGQSQPILVLAHYSDGRTEDVTRWAKFTAANASVAVVDEHGMVTVQGRGEGAISALYLSKIAVTFITVPFAVNGSAGSIADLPSRNDIDDKINAKLTRLGLQPNGPCTDSEFLRRTTLDTLGVLPTPDEVRAFIADTSPNKRDAWIEALLGRPEFVDYWTYKWCDLLLVNSSRLPTRTARSYHRWIRQRVESNMPWDQFARELVTAQGSTAENGAVAFFLLHDDPRTMAETTTQAFLGTSINCARCHNHPMEKWTNDDYFAFANLFARLRIKNGPDPDRIVVNATQGDLLQPRTGKVRPPRPLDGDVIAPEESRDRRAVLADWLTSPANPYFAKAIVNRVWANFFGVGLVERVDDLRATNPASNEELFQALADKLAARHFDLKSLMRDILKTAAYQRSSEPRADIAGDSRFYSRYYPRRLMAEVALDAISQATLAPTRFTSDSRPGQKPDVVYPQGFRALQLPDSFVDSYFLKSFGKPDRIQTCECERSSEPSVAQVLHLSNGDTVNQKLTAKGNRIDALLEREWDPARILDESFIATLSRTPRPKERAELLERLRDCPVPGRRALVEDIFWALLSSKEFLFNH